MILIVWAVIFIHACSTQMGKNFNDQSVLMLQPGVTSFDEAKVIFNGEPQEIAYKKDGTEAQWFNFSSYMYWSSVPKSITLHFDEQRVLTRVINLSGIYVTPEQAQRLGIVENKTRTPVTEH